MLNLFDSHTIELITVFFELLFSGDFVSDLIRHQQFVLAITTTLYKFRIEQDAIEKANDIETGKNNACVTYVLYALAAFIPGVGFMAIVYQITEYSWLFNPRTNRRLAN